MAVLHGQFLGKRLCKLIDVEPAEVTSVALRVTSKPEVKPVMVVNGRDAFTLEVDPTLLGSFLCSKIGVDPARVSSLRVVAHANELARIDAEIIGTSEVFDDETFEYLAGFECAPVEVA